MGRYRNYSDDDKATAVAYFEACGGNLTHAARECRVPIATLQRWVSERDCPSSPSTELVEAKKGNLADRFEELAWRCVNAAMDKILDAPLASTATCAGIAVDKMRLLREESTQNVRSEHVSTITVEEARQETAALMAEAIALYEALSPVEKAALLRQSQEAQGGIIEATFTDIEDGGDGEDDDGEDPDTQTDGGVVTLHSVGLNGTNRTDEHNAVVSY